MHLSIRLTLLFSALILAIPPVLAWHAEGHGIITRAAIEASPKEMPSFFRKGGDLASHLSFDPDVFRNRDVPTVAEAEAPEHFFDVELLKGKPVPPTRYHFLKLCTEIGVEPNKIGTLPYSVTEWTERLTIAFAEHRKWPDDPHIRTKCLVYAGILGHYAGDLCMPLHTTVHFDGRVGQDGKVGRRGIHARTDALIERLDLSPQEMGGGVRPEAFETVLPSVLKELEASHAMVDRVYELEAGLPPADAAPWKPTPLVRAFGLERGRSATRFLSSLYLTAWEKSASIKLPSWLIRKSR